MGVLNEIFSHTHTMPDGSRVDCGFAPNESRLPANGLLEFPLEEPISAEKLVAIQSDVVAALSQIRELLIGARVARQWVTLHDNGGEPYRVNLPGGAGGGEREGDESPGDGGLERGFGWSGKIGGKRWDCAIPGFDYSAWPEGEPCPIIDGSPPPPPGGWLKVFLESGADGFTDTLTRLEPWSDEELDALAAASLERAADA